MKVSKVGQIRLSNATLATRMTGQPYSRGFSLPAQRINRMGGGLGLAVLCLGVCVILIYSRAGQFAARRSRRFALAGAASVLLLGGLLLAVSGCGGGSSSAANTATPPGTTTLVVTATSGQISHSTNIALTVH